MRDPWTRAPATRETFVQLLVSVGLCHSVGAVKAHGLDLRLDFSEQATVAWYAKPHGKAKIATLTAEVLGSLLQILEPHLDSYEPMPPPTKKRAHPTEAESGEPPAKRIRTTGEAGQSLSSASSPSAGEGGAEVQPVTLEQYRYWMRIVYEHFKPDDVPEIDRRLAKYPGQEAQLFTKLLEKYMPGCK